MTLLASCSRDTADLLRLGARYGLHPLHVEDCLRLDRQKAKSVTHNDSTFITMPILRLTKQVRPPRPPRTRRQVGWLTALVL